MQAQESHLSRTKIYFPNLNGIRFIAAFLVIIHHVEQIKSVFGLENKWGGPFIGLIGKLGVVLFFVLSGFLISYLLLIEEQETGTISIKEFYVRRILRIWPLYYLIIGLGFLVFCHIPFFHLGNLSDRIPDHFGTKLVLFLLFLPNLAFVMFAPVPFASQAWSVGVEEQFYLIWPVLMKKIKKKKLLLYGIIFGYVFIKVVCFRFVEKYVFWNSSMETLRSFFEYFNIDCMAIGGLFAVYLFNKARVLKFLFSSYLQWVVLILLCVFISLGIRIPYIHYEFYGVLFGIMIINLAANKNTILKLENKSLHYLGKISYGLYMYHPIAIVVALKFLVWMDIKNTFIQYGASISLSIILAGLSYKYFENYFIRKKIKFSKILSGENAGS